MVKGDTLWDIASRYCGSGPAWKHIYEANRDHIKNPHWIYPGQEFRVACGGSPPAPPPPPPRQGSNSGVPPGNGIHRVQPAALTFARGLPLDPGRYSVGQTIGAPRDGGRRKHEGLDLMAKSGTPIRAIGDGTVIRTGYIGGYGWVVYLKHPNGFESRYAHMASRPAVRSGQRVKAGTVLGPVGATGNASGPHLHFEVRNASGKPLDPHTILRF